MDLATGLPGCLPGLNCSDLIHISAEEREENEKITLAPNPGDHFRIVGIHRPASVQLFAADGRLLATEEITGEDEIKTAALLQPGVYLVRVSAKGKMLFQGKWMKME